MRIYVALLAIAGPIPGASAVEPQPAPSATSANCDCADPPYPLNGRAGTVVVNVCVTAEGQFAGAKVVTPSGDEELDADALASVKQLKFRVRLKDGTPVEYCKDYKVEFKPSTKAAPSEDSAQ